MFYKLRNPSKKTGEATVNLVYRDSEGKEFLRSTGVSVKPAYFNTKTGKVSGKDGENVEKNEAISKVARLFETVERRMKEEGGHSHSWLFKKFIAEQESFAVEYNEGFTEFRNKFISRADTVRHQISRLEKLLAAKQAELKELEDFTETSPAKNKHLFSELLSAYHQHQKNTDKQPGTIKAYKVMGNGITRFRPNLYIEDIDLSFLNELKQHLIKDGCRNSYISIFFVKFLAFYKWAAEELGLDTAFLKKFVSVKADNEENVIYLTESELKAFEELPIDSAMQHKTRELFLFAVETGIRYSDYLFSPACIQSETYVTETGEWVNGKVLRLTTQKTKQKIAVPLSEKALAILERNNYKFNRPVESNFNGALRAMAERLPELQNIITESYTVGNKLITDEMPKWKAITSHVARKTFIDRAISKGASIMTVAQWVGHSDIDTIQRHYANKAELAKREAYKILN